MLSFEESDLLDDESDDDRSNSGSAGTCPFTFSLMNPLVVLETPLAVLTNPLVVSVVRGLAFFFNRNRVNW